MQCDGRISRLGGDFYNGVYFFWGGDFKFISVQIACEGPSGAGGGIMGSG